MRWEISFVHYGFFFVILPIMNRDYRTQPNDDDAHRAEEPSSVAEDLHNAVETLRRGGLVLYPTDTVWGLGCDATNPRAVERLRALKGRSAGKAMLVLVDSPQRVEQYVEMVPEVAWELMEWASEPLTIIYDKGVGFAPGVCADDGSIGIRVAGEEYSRRLCRGLGRPVVSTSANLAGEITPANFEQISETLRSRVDYVAFTRRDAGEERMPSHIVRIGEGGLVKIIR